jgi:hypothetical protein
VNGAMLLIREYEGSDSGQPIENWRVKDREVPCASFGNSVRERTFEIAKAIHD